MFKSVFNYLKDLRRERFMLKIESNMILSCQNGIHVFYTEMQYYISSNFCFK